jgi:hypothetical protein
MKGKGLHFDGVQVKTKVRNGEGFFFLWISKGRRGGRKGGSWKYRNRCRVNGGGSGNVLAPPLPNLGGRKEGCQGRKEGRVSRKEGRKKGRKEGNERKECRKEGRKEGREGGRKDRRKKGGTCVLCVCECECMRIQIHRIRM